MNEIYKCVCVCVCVCVCSESIKTEHIFNYEQ